MLVFLLNAMVRYQAYLLSSTVKEESCWARGWGGPFFLSIFFTVCCGN